MRVFLSALAALPCTLCVGGAIYMSVNGVSGWGWMLFVAVFLSPIIKIKH